MSPPHLSTELPMSDLDWRAVLPYFLSVVTALVAWFAKRPTEAAKFQASLFDASRALMDQFQEERVQAAVRISELERDLATTRLECLQKEGEIRGLKQLRDSLLRLKSSNT